MHKSASIGDPFDEQNQRHQSADHSSDPTNFKNIRNISIGLDIANQTNRISKSSIRSKSSHYSNTLYDNTPMKQSLGQTKSLNTGLLDPKRRMNSSDTGLTLNQQRILNEIAMQNPNFNRDLETIRKVESVEINHEDLSRIRSKVNSQAEQQNAPNFNPPINDMTSIQDGKRHLTLCCSLDKEEGIGNIRDKKSLIRSLGSLKSLTMTSKCKPTNPNNIGGKGQKIVCRKMLNLELLNFVL